MGITNEDEFDQAEVDYYHDFMNEDMLDKVEIVSFDIIEGSDGKKYAVYYLQVVTKLQEAKIPKRYSNFYDLSQIVQHQSRLMMFSLRRSRKSTRYQCQTHSPRRNCWGTLTQLSLNQERSSSMVNATM